VAPNIEGKGCEDTAQSKPFQRETIPLNAEFQASSEPVI
jgi:hypothetical protein